MLLLDEMTANVDPVLKRNIWDALMHYRKLYSCAIILASHDPAEMLEMADKIVFLNDGTNIAQGSIADIYLG